MQNIFQISFLIPPKAVPGRLGLLVTLCLCALNTLNLVSEKAPQTDEGSTALVKWINLCMMFIFVATSEYAIILYIRMIRNKPGTKSERIRNSLTRKMDLVSLVVFPLSFLVAAFAFWANVLQLTH